MIFIPGNTPSSKNSKRWTGRFLINSKVVMKYKKAVEYDFLKNKATFKRMLEGKEKPYKIQFKFVRDSKRRFDLINACQLPLDLMVEYGWIDDDNADEVIPVFDYYEYDKKNAGCYITVL